MPNFLLPATAITAAVSAMLATGAGFQNVETNDALRLTAAEASVHANKVFDRADLDKSGAMSADEFTALSIVTAELAHLNGYVVIETEGLERTIDLPIEAPAALSYGERARIEAVARNAFYAAAGGDRKLTKAEFAKAQSLAFDEADRNRNGALAKRELSNFAAGQAKLSPGV